MQVYSTELYHYGVLGMKWGKRKAKKESISITRSRDKLSTEKNKLRVAKRKYSMNSFSQKNLINYEKAMREYRYAKEDLQKNIILDKLNTKGKSNQQLKLEAKYKQKGLSDDEATIAAYNNIRTKKILAAVGSTTLVAATAYGGYKMWESRVDRIIKSGTTLQNIASDSDEGLRDTFYSSKNRLDKIKYKGLYGSHIMNNGKSVVNKQIKVLSDIKQASYKNAHSTLKELANNDKEFINTFHKYISKNKDSWGDGSLGKVMAKANNSLSKGNVDKNVYDAFNILLVDHNSTMQPLTDKFFNALSDKGYNAIKDINDSKYSGYSAINPIIAFNTKGKVGLSNISKLTDNEISKAKRIEYARMYGSEMIKQGSMAVNAVLGIDAVGNIIKKQQDSKIIADYRRDRPNSELSNTEIIRMIERGKSGE